MERAGRMFASKQSAQSPFFGPPEADLTPVKLPLPVNGKIAAMLNRVIPIRPAPPALAATATEPLLRGQPDQLGHLLAGLERLARAEFGSTLPRSAWLRGLNLDGGEAVLSLAPALRRQGAGFAQAAFDLMKTELSDTDIYVRAAAH
jgi:hypothetical protein